MSQHNVCVQRALVYKVQACKTAAIATFTRSPYDSASREASKERYDLTTSANDPREGQHESSPSVHRTWRRRAPQASTVPAGRLSKSDKRWRAGSERQPPILSGRLSIDTLLCDTACPRTTLSSGHVSWPGAGLGAGSWELWELWERRCPHCTEQLPIMETLRLTGP